MKRKNDIFLWYNGLQDEKYIEKFHQCNGIYHVEMIFIGKGGRRAEQHGGDLVMSVAELTAGVQYTIDQQGQVTAVVVQPLLWKRIIEALEDAEDRTLVQALQARLAAGPVATGALRWDEIADQWQ